MRATISITIALILGLALGCPATRAQDLKSNEHRDAAADKGAAQNKANREKEESDGQATVAAPPEILTIDGAVAPAASEVEPVVGIQQEPGPAAPRVSLFTLNSSAEVGWRFLSTDGNFNQFRSDLNFDRGIRLLSSDFLLRPTNGGGVLFDSLLVNTFGWGGDPSQFVHALVEKTKIYKFDANYRRISYFNNLSNFALGQHTGDTQYQVGDFDLTLLPQNNRLKLNLGYSMDYNRGLSFSTYDYQRDEFPITVPTRTSGNDYRFGADARLWLFDLSFMQGFRYFK